VNAGAAHHYFDLTPLGRHEEDLLYPMDYRVRLRDQYQPAPVQASCCIASEATQSIGPQRRWIASLRSQ
jgi:hypothetical protein